MEPKDSEIYFRVYISLVKSGLMAQLGAKRVVTLLALASYMDKEGSCFPSQKELANKIGVSERTVNDYVNSLREFRWDGKPIIERVKKSNGLHHYSIYKILPISQVAIFDGEVEVLPNMKEGSLPKVKKSATDMKSCSPPNMNEPSSPNSENFHNNYNQDIYIQDNNNQLNNSIGNGNIDKENNGNDNTDTITVENKQNINKTTYSQNTTTTVELKTLEDMTVEKEEFKNAKDILTYFLKKYREKYSVNATPNYGRDQAIIKNKLMANYSMAQIKEIIDVAFAQYDTWGNLDKYPRVSLGALTTWLPNKVLEHLDREKKQEDKIIEYAATPENGGLTDEQIMRYLEGGSKRSSPSEQPKETKSPMELQTPAKSIHPGDKVEHVEFGQGTLVSIEDYPGKKVLVSFPKRGFLKVDISSVEKVI